MPNLVRKTCVSCGHPYDDEATLTTTAMEKHLRRSRYIVIISMFIAVVSGSLTLTLWPSSQKPTAYEATGPGIVRWVNYQGQLQILHEDQKGFMKMLSPVCGKQLEVWQKMQANIRYRWNGPSWLDRAGGPNEYQQCFEILNVQRTGPDVAQ